MRNLLNLGKILNKNEQKVINGGCPTYDRIQGNQCTEASDCHESDYVGLFFIEVSCANGYCLAVDA